MTTLREQIASMIDNELSGYGSYNIALGLADSIIALAAGSRRAETNADLAQCEASQSGPKGNAPHQSRNNQHD